MQDKTEYEKVILLPRKLAMPTSPGLIIKLRQACFCVSVIAMRIEQPRTASGLRKDKDSLIVNIVSLPRSTRDLCLPISLLSSGLIIPTTAIQVLTLQSRYTLSVSSIRTMAAFVNIPKSGFGANQLHPFQMAFGFRSGSILLASINQILMRFESQDL